MSDLYACLLAERFGPLGDIEIEREPRRLPQPWEVARRRRVLAALALTTESATKENRAA